jgi:hypothetical protein
MANISFSYLYIDSDREETYDDVVFTNKDNLPFAVIEKAVIGAMTKGIFFYAEKVGLPSLKPEGYKEGKDPAHHEFEAIEETKNSVSDGRDIAEFLIELSKNKVK